MLKIVLDTNNLISAQICQKGYSNKIYTLWKANKIELLTSPFQLKELKKVLNFPRIKKKYGLTKIKIDRLVKIIKRQAKVVYPLFIPKIIEEDFFDNQILAIAQEGEADFIISGDQHLLKLKKIGNTPIISARKFLKKLA